MPAHNWRFGASGRERCRWSTMNEKKEIDRAVKKMLYICSDFKSEIQRKREI